MQYVGRVTPRVRIATLLRAATLASLVAVAMLWPAPGTAPPAPAEAEETVTVLVGNIYFCGPEHQDPGPMCETVINVGDTVVWDFTPAYAEDPDCVDCIHTTTDCGVNCNNPTTDPLWDSGMLPNVGEGIFTYQFTFEQPGTYLYYCMVHPLVHRGRLVVLGEMELVGDANCDETVNAIDAAFVLQYAAGIINSLPCQGNGDTNEDGSINAIDAALILQYSAGIIHTLPP